MKFIGTVRRKMTELLHPHLVSKPGTKYKKKSFSKDDENKLNGFVEAQKYHEKRKKNELWKEIADKFINHYQ